MGDPGVILVVTGQGAGSFVQRIDGLSPDAKYYLRAFATSAEGTATGSSIRVQTADYERGPGWADASPSSLAQGWWSSPWFGLFHFQDGSGWIHHMAMGWAYAMPASGGGVWLWTEATGWALDGRGNLSLPTFPRFSVLALFLWKVQRPNPLLSIRRQPMAFPRCRNQPSMMRSLNGKIAFFNLEIIRLLGFVNFYIFLYAIHFLFPWRI